MRKCLRLLLSCSVLLVASGALADDKAEKKPTTAGSATTSGGLRRDPKGIKGISPFWEAVKKGDSAFVARDFDGAIASYRDAITAEPQNALGH